MSESVIETQPQRRIVRSLLLIGCVLTATIAGAWLDRTLSSPPGMEVSFHNVSNAMIQSIKLDFGNPDGQSSLLTLRIPPGEERVLLLNHEPGMGFNVRVNYVGGITQEFCALKGDERRQVRLDLKP